MLPPEITKKDRKSARRLWTQQQGLPDCLRRRQQETMSLETVFAEPLFLHYPEVELSPTHHILKRKERTGGFTSHCAYEDP